MVEWGLKRFYCIIALYLMPHEDRISMASILITYDFVDQCDTPPLEVEPEYIYPEFLDEPTVHIHTYNDENDPNYLVT